MTKQYPTVAHAQQDLLRRARNFGFAYEGAVMVVAFKTKRGHGYRWKLEGRTVSNQVAEAHIQEHLVG